MSDDTVITIHKPLTGEVDKPMLAACLERCANYTNLITADIYTCERVPDSEPDYKHPGWLEFTMVLIFRHEIEATSGLTLGCIQRDKGEQFEFHS